MIKIWIFVFNSIDDIIYFINDRDLLIFLFIYLILGISIAYWILRFSVWYRWWIASIDYPNYLISHLWGWNWFILRTYQIFKVYFIILHYLIKEIIIFFSFRSCLIQIIWHFYIIKKEINIINKIKFDLPVSLG